ncbi:MAG: glucuronate isomerase [Gemmatimonadota bacterium]|nr:glucuronate isomerase [Gemmatimonadota bacterium]
MTQLKDKTVLREFVFKTVRETSIFDMHTHIYTPSFGNLLLWGVNELLTYHYLVAEFFRYSDLTIAEFNSMNKNDQAALIWKTLFIDHSPVSESNRGVLTTLQRLGLDVRGRDLGALQAYFRDVGVEEHLDKVFELANVEAVVMTNDPFDESERPVWLEGKGAAVDPRFKTALRIDPLLMDWERSAARLAGWGYKTSVRLDETTLREIRRFLEDWIAVMKPLYLAVSLPPSFRYPEESERGRIIEKCIVPVTREAGIPFAMMIGVNKLVNPVLGLAGDGVGKGDVSSVEALAREFPENKFLVTFLSRENQHEVCITARKFSNVMLFGCWWFMNNPSIIREITAERLELLGTSFVPQHSDARVLDQLIYKWTHSREIVFELLCEKYEDIMKTGWLLTEEEVARDVKNLFSGNIKRFLKIV